MSDVVAQCGCVESSGREGARYGPRPLREHAETRSLVRGCGIDGELDECERLSLVAGCASPSGIADHCHPPMTEVEVPHSAGITAGITSVV